MANELSCNLPTMEAYSESLGYYEQVDSESLSDLVIHAIQDSSYSYADILRYFNQGLRYISGKILLDDLETFTDVATDPGVNNIPLPADFQRDLRYCHSITHNRQIRVKASVLQMYRQFSELDQSGNVIMVATKGGRLYYQRVPSTAETLRINYWSYPERLTSRWQKPTCLPAHLVEDLLVNYACWKIFEKIEDGIEGQKVNTLYYKGLFDKAMEDLQEYIGPEHDEITEIETEIDWEAYI